MADVGRITELWRAAADALELPGVVEGTVPSQWLLDEQRRRQRAEAECGRLREQLDAARKERDQVYAVNAAAANDRANAAADALEEIVALCEPNRIPLPLLNSRILRVARAALGVEGEQEKPT